LFQGDADPVVRVEGPRKIVEAIKQTGTTLAYDEYPNVQHVCWVNAYQNGAIFDEKGLELVPGLFITGKLWAELSVGTQGAIWKYLSSLLLLAASDSTEGFLDMSGFHADMENMIKQLKEAGEGGFAGLEGMGDIFEKLKDMAKGFGMPDLGGLGGAFGGEGGLPNFDPSKFKIPERLYKGHIAKIAQEIVQEFKPEDFGITPELLESADSAGIFNYLQEIFTKRPEFLMTAAQKIAKKIQAKFQRGEIRREDIIREAEELMAEFAENETFSSLFGSLGEMLKASDKESGNEGSARRREVQERLRRKTAEKEAKRANTKANTVVTDEAALRAAAEAMSALLAEEEALAAKKGDKKRK
jgi:hypothetical protein